MNRKLSQYSEEELKHMLQKINEEIKRRSEDVISTVKSVGPNNFNIQAGQEVEDMIVIRVNLEEGTFIGRDNKEIEWECKIEDFFPSTFEASKKKDNHTGSCDTNDKENESDLSGLIYSENISVEPEMGETIQLVIDKLSDAHSASPELIQPKKSMPGTLSLFEENEPFKQEKALISVASIRPTGTIRGVPQKTSYPRKSEIKLNLKQDATLAEEYEVGLKVLIQEMKHKGAASKQVVLEGGIQIPLEGRELGYQFPYDGEADLFEGARAIAIVHGAEFPGRIVAVMEKQIIISFQDDFGIEISFCVLRVDNTAMLEALRDRLEKINKGEVTDFNTRLANAVIRNEGEEVSGSRITELAIDNLNTQQTEAISKVLSNEVFYIWGPPGTGKTKTLGVLNRLLLDKNKRVLLCSNTNQAVDQVLLALCDGFGKKNLAVLEDGKIVRIGKIAHKSLMDKWSSYITVDGIVDRKSVALKKRKCDLELQLDKMNRTVSNGVTTLNEFKRLDKLLKDVSKQKTLYANERKNLDSLLDQEQEIAGRIRSLKEEKQVHFTANILRKVFLRSKETIDQEIEKHNVLALNLTKEIERVDVFTRHLNGMFERIVSEASHLQAALASYDRKAIEKQLSETEKEKQLLINEINGINKQFDDIAKTVLMQARIVGATVTKAFLSPQLFDGFDVVIVDEASMVILPAVFYVAGLAKEKVVISGDPFQLPPIIQTEQEEIYNSLGRDVFTIAGTLEPDAKRVIMLTEQYRMHDDICKLISSRIYNGNLYTGERTSDDGYVVPPEPFTDVLTVVDTSTIWPFVSRDPFKSRYNLMNALAIRNLCRFLEGVGYINSKSRVGICTPYAAQSKILQRILANEGLADKVEAGTVHRYQGDEKTVIILDIPDSWGEQNAGIFLQADNPMDDGAKLFNVGVSRSKEHLIAVANLAYLDKKLPQHSVLRGILSDMELRGKVIDVRDILALWPVTQELRKYGQTFDLSIETLETGLFNERDFNVVCFVDIERAKKSVVIFSGFVTPQRVASYESVIRRKTDEGVAVRCVTRPPGCNGSIPFDDGTVALDALESWGCIVDTRSRLHEKAVIIDERIVWFGSLNPLSHTSKTNEVMARIEGEFLALQLGAFLSLNRSARKDSPGTASQGENPRCPQCDARASYWIGKYGAYWKCEKCDWSESLKQTRKREPKLSAMEAPVCPLCGSGTIPKAGSHGDFYSCSNFPSCKGTVSAQAGKKTDADKGVKTKRTKRKES